MTTRTVALLMAIALSGVPQAGEPAPRTPFRRRRANTRPRHASTADGRCTSRGGPHGDMTMGLELSRTARRSAERLRRRMGDLPVEGELVEATLTIASLAAATPRSA